MRQACSKCFYKKAHKGKGFCHKRKDPPMGPYCHRFKDYPITEEDKRLAMDDPFWSSAIRAAEGLG